MLRWMMPLTAVALITGSACAGDLNGGAGFYGKAPPVYGRPAPVQAESDLLFTPATPDERFPYIRIPPPTPLLPGSSALPGYYGSHFSYEYRPYYGGPNLSYWYRLPYACGVYGYC
jgi:hypothetical protein